MFIGLGSELRVVDHLTHSCCDSGELRGLAQWNIPSFGICGMRSCSYNPEVTNGEEISTLMLQISKSYPAVNAMEFSPIFPFLEVS